MSGSSGSASGLAGRQRTDHQVRPLRGRALARPFSFLGDSSHLTASRGCQQVLVCRARAGLTRGLPLQLQRFDRHRVAAFEGFAVEMGDRNLLRTRHRRGGSASAEARIPWCRFPLRRWASLAASRAADAQLVKEGRVAPAPVSHCLPQRGKISFRVGCQADDRKKWRGRERG